MKHVDVVSTTMGVFSLAEKHGTRIRCIINGCARDRYIIGDYFVYKSISPTCDFWAVKYEKGMDIRSAT